MGVGGIGIWQLLIILVIIILLFGTKKLKNVGGDLGGAIKNFKKSMGDENSKKGANTDTAAADNKEPEKLEKKESNVVDGEVVKEAAKETVSANASNEAEKKTTT